MKMNRSMSIFAILMAGIILFSCGMSRTQKGAGIGAVSGGVIGAVVGKTLGNTALGAITGAAIGGVAGAVIGRKMDKQAEEIEKSVPGTTVTRVGEGIEVEFSEKILFGFDKSGLSAEAKANLDKAIVVLEKYPDTDIEIQGHTDSRGTESYNQQLSVKRSTAVANYLYSKGMASERLRAIGYGEGYPKYTNETTDGQALNRRVEFLITANAKMKEEARIEAEK